MTRLVEFQDAAAPDWPATVLVDGLGGSVKLWRPRGAGRRAYFALTSEQGADEIVVVAWSRPPGERATYQCAACGSGHRRDYCRHTRAATVAADEFERSERHATD